MASTEARSPFATDQTSSSPTVLRRMTAGLRCSCGGSSLTVPPADQLQPLLRRGGNFERNRQTQLERARCGRAEGSPHRSSATAQSTFPAAAVSAETLVRSSVL